MALDPTGADIILGWAVIRVFVRFLATAATIFLGNAYLLQALLVARQRIHLLVDKEGLLGPLGSLPGCGNRHALIQSQVWLSKQVLLEFGVVEAAEQEGEDGLLAVVVHGLAGGAADLKITLSGLSFEAGQEGVDTVGSVLLQSVEFCSSCLGSLAGHTALDNVVLDLLLGELAEIIAKV